MWNKYFNMAIIENYFPYFLNVKKTKVIIKTFLNELNIFMKARLLKLKIKLQWD